VASREPTPLAALLPDVLGKLARDGQGGAAALGPLWTRIQGPVIGAQSWPLELVDGVLRIDVQGATWRATLQAQEAVLRERWNAAVRHAPVLRIEFRVAPLP
jgi:predicted nucleic acid-binding Zn ribbon protein